MLTEVINTVILGLQIMQRDFYILREDCRQLFHWTPDVDCVRFPEETIICEWGEAFEKDLF